MAKKQKKAPRPKAETPKGFRDYFGTEVVRRNEMLARITEVYHAYGFDPLESSAVETVEALGKFLPDVDRPNEGTAPSPPARRMARPTTPVSRSRDAPKIPAWLWSPQKMVV